MLLSSRLSVLVLKRSAATCWYTTLNGCYVMQSPVLLTKTTSRAFRFSTSKADSSEKKSISPTTLISSQGRRRWRILARVVKYVRIPFLVISVYGLGYQQGICDYSRDPSLKEQVLMDSVLAGVGGGSVESSNSMLSSTQLRNVQHVGTKIVAVAQIYVKQKLKEAVQDANEGLPPDLTRDQLELLLSQNEQVLFWDHARKRLEGNWSYLLVESKVPNAFVSEILPKKVFMTTSMFQFIANDDELALVLGHEVSHLILGHVSEMNMLQTMLRTIEVLLLSLDPMEGLLSIGIVALLATTRSALTAAHSRDNELEADELGIKLAAMACYDTARAAQVFYKMHQYSQENLDKNTPSYLSFLDSHPPSVERHEQLVLQSELENVQKYQDTTCASIGTKIKGLLQPKEGNKEKN